MIEVPMIGIASPQLSAVVSPLGAELQWLKDGAGRDLLWDGDPAWWTGRAPILFPVIGAVAGGVIRVDGKRYPMAKHGFARQLAFTVADQDDAAVTLRLEADDATRASYPFDFRLDLRYAIDGPALAVDATLSNPGSVPLPASLGFHPAFRWPQPDAGARAAHRVRFDHAEPAPIRRIGTDGLLLPDARPSPIEGDLLTPRDALFEDDALIFDRLASRAVTFGAPGERGIRVSFPDMPLLGIWTKPGAPFLCIEPWQGVADPKGFTGAFRDKPGVIEVAPGAARTFSMRLEHVDLVD